MDNVSFDSEAELSQAIPAQKATVGITAWLVSKKIVKDERQANHMLLGVLAVCILIIGFALANVFTRGSSIDAKERMRLEQTTPLYQ